MTNSLSYSLGLSLSVTRSLGDSSEEVNLPSLPIISFLSLVLIVRV